MCWLVCSTCSLKPLHMQFTVTWWRKTTNLLNREVGNWVRVFGAALHVWMSLISFSYYIHHLCRWWHRRKNGEVRFFSQLVLHNFAKLFSPSFLNHQGNYLTSVKTTLGGLSCVKTWHTGRGTSATLFLLKIPFCFCGCFVCLTGNRIM